uniref:Paraneoplastic antigen Ma-like C-terminal domain-containing protein n=1 Tax=Cyprinus carpio TaxID=7962 RepID=A0A8C2JMK6_CYPCA
MTMFGRIEEMLLYANDIEDDTKKRSVLLSVCAKTLSTLRSVLAPTQPSTVTYGNTVAALKRHYSPAPSEIAQHFRFHNCKQKPNQSISNYIAELRHLSVHCTFGDQLDAMLRDRIMCGFVDESLQQRLLAEPTLTFKETEEKALAAETACLNPQTQLTLIPQLHHVFSKPTQFLLLYGHSLMRSWINWWLK